MTHETIIHRVVTDDAIRDRHFLEFETTGVLSGCPIPHTIFARSVWVDGDTLHVVSAAGNAVTYHHVTHLTIRPCSGNHYKWYPGLGWSLEPAERERGI